MRRRDIAAIAAGVLLVSAIVAYGRYGFHIARWGCPTNEELNRDKSVKEVVAAFEYGDVPLERISTPAWLPPTEPAYRGAQAFRYAAPHATVYVLVCRQRCAISRFRFGAAREVGEQRWYMGLDSNNNVPIWVTEARPRAGLRALETTARARREVQPYIEYGSRCYIN